MPTLTPSAPAVEQRLGRFLGRHVAADHVDAGEVLLDPLDAIEHALVVAVRGIDDQEVDARLHHALGALVGIGAGADRAADAQLAELVLGRERVLGGLGDVLDGDQAAQDVVVVDHQHPLQPVLVHQFLGLFEARAFAHGDEPLARRHDFADRGLVARFEPEVAVGDDADDALAFDDRQAGDLVGPLQVDRVADGHVLRDRDRVAQHAGFMALDLQHLGGLLRGRHVLVHDADAAFLREGDRQARLGDGIHRRRHERDVQCDVPGDFGRELHVARQYRRVGGDEQHVIEGQRLLNQPHSCPHDAKAEYTGSIRAQIGRQVPPSSDE